MPRRATAGRPAPGSSASTSRISARPAKMPLPTRAAKRRAGFDRRDGRRLRRLPLGRRGQHLPMSSDLARAVRARPEWWPNRRGRGVAGSPRSGAELVAQRAHLLAQPGDLASRRSTRAARPSSEAAAAPPARPARRAPASAAGSAAAGARTPRSGSAEPVRVALPALARPARQRPPPARARPAPQRRGPAPRRSRSGGCARCAGAARPGVCGPRSISTVSSASCASSRPSAWSNRCLYLTERAVDQLASVVHLRRPSRSSAERIVASS